MSAKPQERGSDQLLRCSFCRKSEKEVRQLVAGPAAFICDECVEICMGITNDKFQAAADVAGRKPKSTLRFVAPPGAVREHWALGSGPPTRRGLHRARRAHSNHQRPGSRSERAEAL